MNVPKILYAIFTQMYFQPFRWQVGVQYSKVKYQVLLPYIHAWMWGKVCCRVCERMACTGTWESRALTEPFFLSAMVVDWIRFHRCGRWRWCDPSEDEKAPGARAPPPCHCDDSLKPTTTMMIWWDDASPYQPLQIPPHCHARTYPQYRFTRVHRKFNSAPMCISFGC
jgi:hypothetical protein